MVCHQRSQKVRDDFAKMGAKWGSSFVEMRMGTFGGGMFWKYGEDDAEGFPHDVPKQGKVVYILMTLLKTRDVIDMVRNAEIHAQ